MTKNLDYCNFKIDLQQFKMEVVSEVFNFYALD
jgi:hypothetical protein